MSNNTTINIDYEEHITMDGKKTIVLPIRQLFKLPAQNIIKDIKGGLVLGFEDGEVKHLKSKEIVLSMFYWEIFRYYPTLPIKSNYIATLYFKNNVESNEAHLDFLEVIAEDIIYGYIQYTDNKGDEIDKMYSLIHDVAENLYDATDEDLKTYVASSAKSSAALPPNTVTSPFADVLDFPKPCRIPSTIGSPSKATPLFAMMKAAFLKVCLPV